MNIQVTLLGSLAIIAATIITVTGIVSYYIH